MTHQPQAVDEHRAAMGRRLRALLAALDMSQADLASVLGTTKQNVSNWCSGIAPLSAHSLFLLARYRDLNICDWIIIGNRSGLPNWLAEKLGNTPPPAAGPKVHVAQPDLGSSSSESLRRNCLREPIADIFNAATVLRRAVDAHHEGDHRRAADLFRAADMAAIRAWTESVWGKADPEIHMIQSVDGGPAHLAKSNRHPGRMPSAEVRAASIRRYGFRCAFCGIPVIQPEVRQRVHRAYPEAVPWGSTNASQHAAFQAMWLQYDHILPHARGGDSSLANIAITCAPCNFGRNNYTLAEVCLADPRDRPVPTTDWNGLEDFR